MRDSLAWATNDQDKANEQSTNPFVWFWEAVQEDVTEDRSTAQILTDAAVSMIPLVDQVCDIRDRIASCRKLIQDNRDTWAWVAQPLTLIGLFPTIGSLVKGALKIFFAFVRRMDVDDAAKAVDAAMTWVIGYLRRRDVQRYLRELRLDEVFRWLAAEIKAVRIKVNTQSLLAAFEKAIHVTDALVSKVSLIPAAGRKAKAALEQVTKVRLMADSHLGTAIKPVLDILDSIVLRPEREMLQRQRGIGMPITFTSEVRSLKCRQSR